MCLGQTFATSTQPLCSSCATDCACPYDRPAGRDRRGATFHYGFFDCLLHHRRLLRDLLQVQRHQGTWTLCELRMPLYVARFWSILAQVQRIEKRAEKTALGRKVRTSGSGAVGVHKAAGSGDNKPGATDNTLNPMFMLADGTGSAVAGGPNATQVSCEAGWSTSCSPNSTSLFLSCRRLTRLWPALTRPRGSCGSSSAPPTIACTTRCVAASENPLSQT